MDLNKIQIDWYLKSVSNDGLALDQVPDEYKTREICLAAVKNNGDAIRYVKNQTQEICLAAVNQSGMALEHVKDQTKDICLAAVNKHGWAIIYVENQTTELCFAAVKRHSESLRALKEQAPELCLLAIEEHNYNILQVRDLSSIALLVSDDFIEKNIPFYERYQELKELKTRMLMASEVNEHINPLIVNTRKNKSSI